VSVVSSVLSVADVVGPSLVSAKTRVFCRLVVDQTPMTGLAVASPFATSSSLGSSSAMVFTL
jgi:hypothetical protein